MKTVNSIIGGGMENSQESFLQRMTFEPDLLQKKVEVKDHVGGKNKTKTKTKHNKKTLNQLHRLDIKELQKSLCAFFGNFDLLI